MFSFFEFFRRRTRDSILAGAYDAAEILEQKPFEESVEKPDGKSLGSKSLPLPPPPATAKKIGVLPSPPAPANGDLFSENPPPGGSPPLPPRKRGRPPKNPPSTPGQP